ncbi:MAG: hypothetical protein ABSG67_21530 [Thermoguttaceae bacterium]|jgi:hypothetical protein
MKLEFCVTITQQLTQLVGYGRGPIKELSYQSPLGRYIVMKNRGNINDFNEFA